MLRRVIGLIAAAAAVGALGAVPASAHHSFAAAFDADKPVSFQGVNSRTLLMGGLGDASGTVQQWGFEAQTPSALIRSGVKPDVFKVGSTVTIRGCHARDAAKNEGAAREIILADGRSYIIGPKGNEPDANR